MNLSGIFSAMRAPACTMGLLLWATQSIAATYINSNFTMIDTSGATFGGTNDLIAEWDGSLNTAVTNTNFNMLMYSASNYPLFGYPPTYHDIRVFGPGSYSFDTTCSVAQIKAGLANCGGSSSDYLDLNIGNTQIGAHILMDWTDISNSKQYLNTDIAVVWTLNDVFAGDLYQGPAGPRPALDTVYGLVSVDGDADGIPGIRMIDGRFLGFSANYNLREVPIPPTPYLFSIGLLGLVRIARRKVV